MKHKSFTEHFCTTLWNNFRCIEDAWSSNSFEITEQQYRCWIWRQTSNPIVIIYSVPRTGSSSVVNALAVRQRTHRPSTWTKCLQMSAPCAPDYVLAVAFLDDAISTCTLCSLWRFSYRFWTRRRYDSHQTSRSFYAPEMLDQKQSKFFLPFRDRPHLS